MQRMNREEGKGSKYKVRATTDQTLHFFSLSLFFVGDGGKGVCCTHWAKKLSSGVFVSFFFFFHFPLERGKGREVRQVAFAKRISGTRPGKAGIVTNKKTKGKWNLPFSAFRKVASLFNRYERITRKKATKPSK